MRIYRISQNVPPQTPLKQEDWYTKDNAWYSVDGEVLRKILSLGREDVISGMAAYNPYCPPDMLIQILKKKGDDAVSRLAAKNPNCPSGILEEVLKRNRRDNVSLNAANNLKCPPEAALKWFSRAGAGIALPDHLSSYLDKKNMQLTEEEQQVLEEPENKDVLDLLS